LVERSPKTHLIASTMLDFPDPLGPTIPDIGLKKSMETFVANDLNPLALNFVKKIILLFI
jgi:hypothetical protein